jgi:ssDNA-binding Zn-finger/Zn-ribbon topoisomerase 1
VSQAEIEENEKIESRRFDDRYKILNCRFLDQVSTSWACMECANRPICSNRVYVEGLKVEFREELNLLDFIKSPNKIELKRIYRCPNCDAMVLEKVTYNYNHFCSCGVITHSKNLKIEYEVA